jgi:hypothetical protein
LLFFKAGPFADGIPWLQNILRSIPSHLLKLGLNFPSWKKKNILNSCRAKLISLVAPYAFPSWYLL